MGFHSSWGKPAYMVYNSTMHRSIWFNLSQENHGSSTLPHLHSFAQWATSSTPTKTWDFPKVPRSRPFAQQGAAVNLAATGFYAQGGGPWLEIGSHWKPAGNRWQSMEPELENRWGDTGWLEWLEGEIRRKPWFFRLRMNKNRNCGNLAAFFLV